MDWVHLVAPLFMFRFGRFQSAAQSRPSTLYFLQASCFPRPTRLTPITMSDLPCTVLLYTNIVAVVIEGNLPRAASTSQSHFPHSVQISSYIWASGQKSRLSTLFPARTCSFRSLWSLSGGGYYAHGGQIYSNPGAICPSEVDQPTCDERNGLSPQVVSPGRRRRACALMTK